MGGIPRSVFLVPLLLSGALTAPEVEKLDRAIENGDVIPESVDGMLGFIAESIGVTIQELWFRTDGGLL